MSMYEITEILVGSTFLVFVLYFLVFLANLMKLTLTSISIKQEIEKEKASTLNGLANNLNSIAAVVISYSKKIDAETDRIKKTKDYKLLNSKKVDLAV